MYKNVYKKIMPIKQRNMTLNNIRHTIYVLINTLRKYIKVLLKECMYTLHWIILLHLAESSHLNDCHSLITFGLIFPTFVWSLAFPSRHFFSLYMPCQCQLRRSNNIHFITNNNKKSNWNRNRKPKLKLKN